MPPRSVTVRLREGVTHAVLPDNRKVSGGDDVEISWETWTKIGGEARRTIFDQDNITYNTGVSAANGTDLTTNTATVPAGFEVGDVLQGHQPDDQFMLVEVVDATVAAGDVLTWADKSVAQVTQDRVGGSALDPLEFAGVAIGAITVDQFGWIQIAGHVPAADVVAGAGAGEPLGVHATTDGSFDLALQNEVQNVETDGTGGTFTLTFDGQETGDIAFDADAATLEAALEALSNIGSDNVQVTGTAVNDAGNGLDVEFIGTLRNTDVAEMTADDTNLTGQTTGTVVTTTSAGVETAPDPVATAVTAESGGSVEAEIRALDGPKVRNRPVNVFTGRG